MQRLLWMFLLAAPAAAPPTLDDAVRAGWTKAKVVPVAAALDHEFLRRVQLDLTGRIPTAADARTFLESADPLKRQNLVDKLIGSPDYQEYQADKLLALLVGRAEKLPQRLRPALRAHLLKSFNDQIPYDVVVRGLLTAAGEVETLPQAAFLFAQSRAGGPEGAAAATANIFLGVQLQCAQCHDHPYYDRYKQQDFHALAAYFSQTRARRTKDGDEKTLAVMDVGKGQAKMKTPQGKEVRVMPRFLGRDFTALPDETRRQTLARAVTSSDLFAKTVVNRTWQELFGRGLVHPWNDLGGEQDTTHPPLLNHLAQQFTEHQHSLPWLHRTLVLSAAYNLSSESMNAAAAAEQEMVFAKAPVRPMDPFQLLESTLRATGVGDALKEKQGDEVAARRREQALKELIFVFGDDEMAEVDSFNGNVPQALVTFNGELVNRGARANSAVTLGKILEDRKRPATRIEEMYLATLSRFPTPQEADVALNYLESAEKPRPAFEDLYFALLTSTEFSTNH